MSGREEEKGRNTLKVLEATEGMVRDWKVRAEAAEAQEFKTRCELKQVGDAYTRTIELLFKTEESHDALADRVRALEAALRKHGRHHAGSSDASPCPRVYGSALPCTCGLEVALVPQDSGQT